MLRLRGLGLSLLVFTCSATARAQEEPASQPAAPAPTAEHALAVANALQRGDLAALEPWLSQWPVEMAFEQSPPEGEPPTPHGASATLANAAEFGDWLARMAPQFACPDRPGAPADPGEQCEWYNGLSVAPYAVCGYDGCCRFGEEEPEPGQEPELDLSHNTLLLNRICFTPTEGGAALRSVHIIDG